MTDGILLNEIHRDRAAARVRHDHHRRGARAQPQHRLPARLPASSCSPGAPTSRSSSPPRRSTPRASPRTSPRRRHARADRRGLRPHLPGRDPLPAARRRGPRGRRRRMRTPVRDRRPRLPRRASTTRSTSSPARRPATCSSSCPARTRSATPRTRSAAATCPAPRCSRSTAGCRPPSSTASSSRPRMPGIRRRVVLATNVAETSLTVPGIKYVIDAGTARITPLQRARQGAAPADRGDLAGEREPALRAASGRTSDGIAIRLYSEEDFAAAPGVHRARDPAHEPRRGHPADDLARPRRHRRVPVPAAAGLARHQGRPRPAARARRDRDATVGRHGSTLRRAVALTKVGRDLAAAADRPALRADGRRVEAARHVARGDGDRRGTHHPGSARAPAREARQADQQHARFADPTSDFLTLLNLWNYLEEKQEELVVERVPPALQGRVPQLPAGARVAGRLPPAAPAGEAARPHDRRARRSNPDGIHQSLLAGLLSPDRAEGPDRIRQQGRRATRTRSREYLGARQTRFVIFPGSALAKKQPNARDERRARRDEPPVRPDERRDRPGLGRSRSPATSCKRVLQRAALGEEAGRGRRLRAGDALRRADHPAAPRAVRAHRPGAMRASCSSGTRSSRASGSSHAGVRPGEPRAPRGARASSRSAPAAATS